MVLPFRINRFSLTPKPGTSVCFQPTGEIQLMKISGKISNDRDPFKKHVFTGETMSARFFVALTGTKFTIDTISTEIGNFLLMAEIPEDIPFLIQAGEYFAKENGKETTDKSGAQIVVCNMNTPVRKFKEIAVTLGEHFCEILCQETVYVEIQENGVSKKVWAVVSEATMKKLEKNSKKNE